jgi:2-iminobutanoate/2-iminopropanoate deaminase
VQFLYEADLIAKGCPILDLDGADLSKAYLRIANLREATLSHTNLSDAFLKEADLSKALLNGANLSKADLSGADLSGAQGITNEELEQQAAYLKGATMPNGQKYEDWLKDREKRQQDE